VNTAIKNLKHIILQRYIFGITARKIVPYVEKFWGVTPMRMEYLRDIYRIPKEKIGLLVMGGDEEKIHRNNREL
jgi:1,2-diacylglycerol 3-alpha-glucosyltransferase